MNDADLIEALAAVGAARDSDATGGRADTLGRMEEAAARRGAGLERQALPAGLVAASLACFAPRPAVEPLGVGGVEAVRALGEALRDAAADLRREPPPAHEAQDD